MLDFGFWILDFGLKNGTHTVTEAELKARMKAFGLRVIRVAEALPARQTGDVISRQLIRSGTSVGANYRAACRAKSTADFRSLRKADAC
jgi:hypothetical protein